MTHNYLVATHIRILRMTNATQTNETIIAALYVKQGVALTGRNTTGPPSGAAPGELRCICECCRCRQTTATDDDRRPLLVSSSIHYV